MLGKNLQNLVYWFGSLWLLSCANVVAPTGGDKDLTPPKILKIQQAKNKIIIYFDEFIQSSDPQKGVTLWPPQSVNPWIKNKKLIIPLSKKHKVHSTQYLLLTPAITDVTEKNPLDTLLIYPLHYDEQNHYTLTGKIYKNDKKTFFVGLFALDSASHPLQLLNKQPTYLTFANAQDQFQFHYIPKGTYWLLGFEDKDHSLSYSSAKEAIAITETLQITIPFNDTITLFPFYLDTIPPKLKRFLLKDSFVVQLSFSESVHSIYLLHTTHPIVLDTFYTHDFKNWFFQWETPLRDTAEVILAYEDSLENQKVDTLTIIPQKRNSKKQVLQFSWADSIAQVQLHHALFIPWDTLKRHLRLQDSLRSYPFTLVYQMPHFTLLQIPLELPEGVFFVVDSTLTGKSLRWAIQYPDYDSWSFLRIRFKDSCSCIGILYKGTAEVATFKSQFEGLLPQGDYDLWVFIDSNKNGKWDNGSLYPVRLPEKRFFVKRIALKMGWDVEETISLKRFLTP